MRKNRQGENSSFHTFKMTPLFGERAALANAKRRSGSDSGRGLTRSGGINLSGSPPRQHIPQQHR